MRVQVVAEHLLTHTYYHSLNLYSLAFNHSTSLHSIPLCCSCWSMSLAKAPPRRFFSARGQSGEIGGRFPDLEGLKSLNPHFLVPFWEEQPEIGGTLPVRECKAQDGRLFCARVSCNRVAWGDLGDTFRFGFSGSPPPLNRSPLDFLRA